MPEKAYWWSKYKLAEGMMAGHLPFLALEAPAHGINTTLVKSV
jgi:hypothetical protein